VDASNSNGIWRCYPFQAIQKSRETTPPIHPQKSHTITKWIKIGEVDKTTAATTTIYIKLTV
jgi:hypothetical protein